MIDSSGAGEILSALGFAAFERNADGTFTPAGKMPAWSSRFHLPDRGSLSRRQLSEIFPLLETFLSDAEEFWEFGQGVLLDSGPWTQPDASGTSCTLQAMTVSASSQRFLLLSLPGAQFEEGKAVVQRARDQALAYGRLKRQVEDLESRNRETEEWNRLNNEYLAGMRHELCTPVNAIVGLAALLAQEAAGSLNEKQKSIAREIGDAARQLLGLIDETLDISGVAGDRPGLRRQAFPLGEGLIEALSVVHPLADAKRIEIRTEDADPDLSLFACQVRFRQVLCHLLRLAMRFTAPDGSVIVATRDLGPEIEIVVGESGSDTAPKGEGRSPEEIKAGLKERLRPGWAILERLVEELGGRLRVESTASRAAMFSFTVPSGTAQPR